jgi:hypothetical protein
MVGTMLVVAAMIFGLSSLLHLLGELGDGAADRVIGVPPTLPLMEAAF